MYRMRTSPEIVEYAISTRTEGTGSEQQREYTKHLTQQLDSGKF